MHYAFLLPPSQVGVRYLVSLLLILLLNHSAQASPSSSSLLLTSTALASLPVETLANLGDTIDDVGFPLINDTLGRGSGLFSSDWPATPFELRIPGDADLVIHITKLQTDVSQRQSRWLHYILRDMIKLMQTDSATKPLTKYVSGDEDIAIVTIQEVNPEFDRNLRPALKAGMEELNRQLKIRGEGALEGVLGQYSEGSPSHALNTLLTFRMDINNNPPASQPWPRLPREFFVEPHQGQGQRTKIRIVQKGPPGDGFDRIHVVLALNSTIKYCQSLRSSYPISLKIGHDADIDLIMIYKPRREYPGSTNLANECRMLLTLRDLFDVKKYKAISTGFTWFDEMNRVIGSGFIKLKNGEASILDEKDALSSLMNNSSLEIARRDINLPSFDKWPSAPFILPVPFPFPRFQDSYFNITKLILGADERQSRWTFNSLDSVLTLLAQNLLQRRDVYQSDPEDVAFVQVTEEVHPLIITGLLINLHASMVELRTQVEARGAAQLEGILVWPKSRIEAVTLAAVKIRYNVRPPRIPSPWPTLPREFPVKEETRKGTKIRIAQKGPLGDGFDRIHFRDAVQSKVDELKAERESAPQPVQIKAHENKELKMKWTPRAEYPGSYDIKLEINMFEALIGILKEYGAMTMIFTWYDAVDRVMGWGYMSLLNGDKPVLEEGQALAEAFTGIDNTTVNGSAVPLNGTAALVASVIPVSVS